ncbi:MAG: sugar transferase [Clostridia bacterium]|nr:sugar transferase [Clostridia bacterium]
MKKRTHDFGLRLIKLLNTILMTLPFALCWVLYYANQTAALFAFNARLYVIAFYVLLYVTFGRVYESFLISYNRVSEMVYSQMLAASVSDGIIYILICFLCKGPQRLWPGLLAIVGQFVFSILWSLFANWWYFSRFEPKKTYIVYDLRPGMDRLVEQYGLSQKFHVEKVFTVAEVLADLDLLSDAEAVFLSDVHSHDRNVIIKYCVGRGIDALVLPRLGDVIMSGATKLHILHLPVLMVHRYNPKPEYLAIKRVFDIVLSALALIVLSPVFLVTALLIKRDGGPAFYRQERLTKDGKTFRLIKFRSMRVDAEKDGVARLSTGENDDRITPVGRVIRKFRIDELPQLLNILEGSLSIVGPRPERPEIAAQYEKEIPEFRLRLQCKAGLTGYAQVYGKYNTTPYDKLMMDMMYIADPGVVQDLRIIFATIKILFQPESTEGVAEGQTTAMEGEAPAEGAGAETEPEKTGEKTAEE